jgi:hypothetical protein
VSASNWQMVCARRYKAADGRANAGCLCTVSRRHYKINLLRFATYWRSDVPKPTMINPKAKQAEARIRPQSVRDARSEAQEPSLELGWCGEADDGAVVLTVWPDNI